MKFLLVIFMALFPVPEGFDPNLGYRINGLMEQWVNGTLKTECGRLKETRETLPLRL